MRQKVDMSEDKSKKWHNLAYFMLRSGKWRLDRAEQMGMTIGAVSANNLGLGVRVFARWAHVGLIGANGQRWIRGTFDSAWDRECF